MTNVTSHTETVTRYVWTVPCADFNADRRFADIGDLLQAYSMMCSSAKAMGINTSFDDWAKVSPTDEGVAVYFDVVQTVKVPF